MTLEKPPPTPDETARRQCIDFARYFEHTSQEFPDNPMWASGLHAARAWLRLVDMSINGTGPSAAEIEALVRYAVPHKRFSGSAWSILCFDLAEWALSKGVDEAKQLEYRPLSSLK